MLVAIFLLYPVFAQSFIKPIFLENKIHKIKFSRPQNTQFSGKK